MNLKPKILKKE